jgi:hypothetical protein
MCCQCKSLNGRRKSWGTCPGVLRVLARRSRERRTGRDEKRISFAGLASLKWNGTAKGDRVNTPNPQSILASSSDELYNPFSEEARISPYNPHILFEPVPCPIDGSTSGRPSGKDRGPHWHDTARPNEHIVPTR